MLLMLAVLAAVPPGCASPRSQAAMNRCAGLEAAAADARMTAQWRATLASARRRDAADTSRGGGFGHAAALLESQRAWLRFRDAQCVAEGGRFAGGSIQPLERDRCRTRLTGERRTQLRDMALP